MHEIFVLELKQKNKTKDNSIIQQGTYLKILTFGNVNKDFGSRKHNVEAFHDDGTFIKMLIPLSS